MFQIYCEGVHKNFAYVPVLTTTQNQKLKEQALQ
jgi:hypothetical protein